MPSNTSPSSPYLEKNTVEVHITDENTAHHGYRIYANDYSDSAVDMKKTKDGRFVLLPQPSDDENDPLNWSRNKKIWTIALIAYISFLADYMGGTAIIVVIPQAGYAGH